MDQRFNVLSRPCLAGVVSLALPAGGVGERTESFKVGLLTPGLRDSIVARAFCAPRVEFVADTVPVVAGR